MRFLLLLLPNFYDIFTAIMIGYAFLLHSDGKLRLSFALACLLIYATTRIGIFAGKLIHMMIGKTATEPEGEQTPEILVKRMLLDFGPQCMFVVICQVVLALLFLNPAAANEAKQLPPTAQPIQEAEQLQAETPATAEQTDSAITSEETAKTSAQTEPDNIATDAEAAAAEAKKAANKTTATPNKTVKTYKRSSAKRTTSQAAVDPNNRGNNTYVVDIPEKTLKSAGISSSEMNANRRQNTAQEIAKVAASSRNNNSNSWTFAAANTTSTVQTRSSLKTKRYPGDDNPLQTNWGYYRNYSNGVDITKGGATAKQQKAADPVRNTIPARTLNSIGY